MKCANYDSLRARINKEGKGKLFSQKLHSLKGTQLVKDFTSCWAKKTVKKSSKKNSKKTSKKTGKKRH